MTPAEKSAALLLKDLLEHCQRERLPCVLLVGCPHSNVTLRGWADTDGQSREILREAVRGILWPNEN